MTTTRTDAHSPINLVTEDYEYVYAADTQGSWARHLDQDFLRELTNYDPATAERGNTQCHHCGAHLRYAAWLRHIPTGRTIVVGETCLDNRFSLATADFQRLRKAAELDRQAQRIKAAAAEFLANLDGDLAIALNRETDLSEAFGLPEGYALSTIGDIRSKLWKWGSVSDRQLAFVEKLLAEHRERVERAANVPTEINVPAPTGRVSFEGTVIKIKEQWSDYAGPYGQGGMVTKLIVKVSEPVSENEVKVWLVYVSEPSSITVDKGDRVAMTATLSHGNEPHFAFGKRPAKATIIARAGDEAPDALA